MGIVGIRENHAEPVHTERPGAISLTTRVRNAHGPRTHATGGGAGTRAYACSDRHPHASIRAAWRLLVALAENREVPAGEWALPL